MLPAGRLDQRVGIEEKAVTRSAIGEEVVTWSAVATVWASVQAIRGREYVGLAAAQSDITTRITVRYLAGLTTAMRVVHGAALYDIVEIIPVGGRKADLELMCRAATVATP